MSPPLLVDGARLGKRALLRALGRSASPEWEFLGDEWTNSLEKSAGGWDVASVLSAYEAKWDAFQLSLRGTRPLGTTPESSANAAADLISHNIMMSYAYALTYSTRQRDSFSMLDWGGGLGHYYLLGKALLPETEIDYHCKDVAVLANRGQQLIPEAHFYTDESCFERKYDFVMASTSLHYSRNWKRVLEGLISASSGYIFVTQLPVVCDSPSFVYLQRAQIHGYGTEYISWCLNRQSFLDFAQAQNTELIREFIVGHRPPIVGAPEQCEYRGFLFGIKK